MQETEERVVGLLRLPEVYGEYACQAFEPKTINIYSSPSTGRRQIGTIERTNPIKPPERPDCDESIVVVRQLATPGRTDPLPYDESGYEFSTAVAYEQSGKWFRIALPQGSGWVERQEPEFIAYPDDLTTESFSTYLRPGWDGNLWTEPGRGTATPAPQQWRTHREKEIPVRVTATRMVDGVAWVQLRFETESCGTDLGALPPLQGWMPAHRSAKSTAIWFYSRGC